MVLGIMVLLFDCFTLDIELVSLLYVQEVIIHFIDNRWLTYLLYKMGNYFLDRRRYKTGIDIFNTFIFICVQNLYLRGQVKPMRHLFTSHVYSDLWEIIKYKLNGRDFENFPLGMHRISGPFLYPVYGRISGFVGRISG